MSKLKIPNNMTRLISRTGLKLKKYSPEILITVGVVGVVASGVLACKATTKVSDILDETKETIDTIHKTAAIPEMADRYTEEDSKKDLAIVYAQTGLKFVKLYGPSVFLGTLSIGCILASNNIIRKRNIALSAAYMALDSNFKDYRQRVIERFDENLDRELRFNIKAKEIEETIVDENGEEKVVKTVVNVIDNPNKHDEFSIIFDEFCAGWDDEPGYNKKFLLLQQNYANERLKANGHLFLNEVYDMLGVPRTKIGQSIGWIYDKDVIAKVDFGIFNIDSERARAFVNGYEKSIILDFNVDGNILDLI